MCSYLSDYTVICDGIDILILVGIAFGGNGSRRRIIGHHSVCYWCGSVSLIFKNYYVPGFQKRRIGLFRIYNASGRYSRLHAAAYDNIALVPGKPRDYETQAGSSNQDHKSNAGSAQYAAVWFAALLILLFKHIFVMSLIAFYPAHDIASKTSAVLIPP